MESVIPPPSAPYFIMADIPFEYDLGGYIFPLPEELIAQEPASRRDASRLMVLDKAGGNVRIDNFINIINILPENCLLIANNSRVIPARLHGRRASGGRVEFLLLTPPPLLRPYAGEETQTTMGVKEGLWQEAEAEGLLKSSKQVRVGEVVEVAPDLSLEVTGRGNFGRSSVRLRWQGDLMAILAREGSLPLPPYIRRPAGEADAERYQTTYARKDKAGSVAAPTAGLHFTPELRAALQASGREWAEVTLYVGYGTFSPVRCQDIREHPMHAEYVEVPLATARAIARAKAEGRAVIAVGTTSARVLEGVWEAQHRPEQAAQGFGVLKQINFETPAPALNGANELRLRLRGDEPCSRTARLEHFHFENALGEDDSSLRPICDEKATDAAGADLAGWVNCFFYPGKEFHVIDGLITNFHLPGSSLLMLVSALAGRENILKAYEQAVQGRFRFFSYGDAMLIL